MNYLLLAHSNKVMCIVLHMIDIANQLIEIDKINISTSDSLIVISTNGQII